MARARPDGWWYPWLFVGGMAFVVVVNVGMAAFAIATFSGLQTTDHYRKGLAYNQTLAAVEAQAALGWRMTIDYSAQAAAGAAPVGELLVVFTDRDHQPLRQLVVEARFLRPTHAGHDRGFALTHVGDGRYRATVALPLAGAWDALIVAQGEEIVFQETRRLVLP